MNPKKTGAGAFYLRFVDALKDKLGIEVWLRKLEEER